MSISLGESLSVIGNSNFIQSYLEYFEKQILEDKEFNNSLSKAPNYYAWINIASEHTFYKIREMLYVNTEDEKNFDANYKDLLDHICNNYKLSQEELDSIFLFAKIRHLLIHKGFPNPHTTPSTKAREICAGVKFTKDEVTSLAEILKNPMNFQMLKAKHEIAMKAIDSCQKDFIHNFGPIMITNRYSS